LRAITVLCARFILSGPCSKIMLMTSTGIYSIAVIIAIFGGVYMSSTQIKAPYKESFSDCNEARGGSYAKSSGIYKEVFRTGPCTVVTQEYGWPDWTRKERTIVTADESTLQAVGKNITVTNTGRYGGHSTNLFVYIMAAVGIAYISMAIHDSMQLKRVIADQKKRGITR
jgi:hypothetical protein